MKSLTNRLTKWQATVLPESKTVCLKKPQSLDKLTCKGFCDNHMLMPSIWRLCMETFCFLTITQTLFLWSRHNKRIVFGSEEKVSFLWLFYLDARNKVTCCQKRRERKKRKPPRLIILSTQHDVRAKAHKLNFVMTGKQNLRNNWMHVFCGLFFFCMCGTDRSGINLWSENSF